MATGSETTNIRGLDIDKTVKGFALANYIFKSLVTNSTMSTDSVRWYQETAADLTATSPSKVANIAPLAGFTQLGPTWTRTVSYAKKYGAEAFISMEDIKGADIDVLARTLLRLTRAVVKQVDTDIYNVLTENQTPVNIGSAGALGTGWDDTTNGNPILDIMSGQKYIRQQDYDASSLVIAMNPKNHADLLNYLITVKGSSIPQFSSEKVQSGVVMNLLGSRVVVSNNVVADSVWLGLPATACTWKSFADITSRVIEDAGIGSKVRVFEEGIAILTDPKCSYLITDTDT